MRNNIPSIPRTDTEQGPHPIGSPVNQAMTYLRNTVAASPRFGSIFHVVAVDVLPGAPSTLELTLSDGSTIHLEVSRTAPRRPTSADGATSAP